MCIQSKTWLLGVSLESDILSRIHDVEAAERLLEEYKCFADSKIAAMAKHYNKHRESYHIAETLGDTGTFTRLSLIRGAIKLVLDEYIVTCRQGATSVFLEPTFA